MAIADVDPYTKMSLAVFGGFVDSNSVIFAPLKEDLRKAGIRMSVDEFVSSGLLTGVLTPLMTAPMAFVLCIALGLPISTTVGVTFLVGVTTAALILSLLYFYPTIKAESMKKSIENALPFATIYLSTLAGTGMTTDAIFKILADFPEYGEISREARGIIADTELFGTDIATALSRAADRTPSEELKGLLWGMRSTLVTGGDLRSFLIEKGKGYMQNYRRNIDNYVEELSLFTELYITAVIVGSIFFIIMSTIMNMIGTTGTAMVMIQNIVIYAVLPMISVGFMLLISMISPT
ncbi:MAG: type II secretion system F family protein [archaeon]